MNVIVSLMAAGAKKNFSKEEFKRIRKEADARYRRLVSENKDEPKALKQHTGMNIFPAIAVYKTLVRHGMEKEAAADVVRQFFVKICGIMFKPVSWYQHIGGNYHRYPAGMVKNSLRDFSPDAGFEYRMPEKVNPAFCDSDDAKYGNLHKNLKWARTGTIGKGASCCDFRIIDISRCPDYKD